MSDGDDRLARLEAARKEAATPQAIGAERFAVQASWYDGLSKGKTNVAPKIDLASEPAAKLVWLPLGAVELLEEWFGENFAPSAVAWRKGPVLNVDPATGKEEIEASPTYAVVEIRTEEKSKAPLAKLEKISALEEIPQLVRKALDAVPSLTTVDEEDVRLWIRKAGESQYQLCSSDEAKNEESSEPEEDLPEQLEDQGQDDNSQIKVVPTLRSVLGPVSSGQTIHLHLELRDAEGKFPSTKTKGSTQKHKNGLNGVTQELTRPASTSFSIAHGPEVGQKCDAQRASDDRWLEAKIVAVDGDKATIHFLSFPSEADEVFPASSPRIQPPYSRIPDWREQLKVGEEVDVHTYAFQLRRGGRLYKLFWEKAGRTAWITGTVRKVERNVPEPRVNVGVRFRWSSPESTAWVPLNSEKIAKRFTHLPRPKAETYGPQNSEGSPPAPGIVGLTNLGNTCYMNSMLQCLSHCDPLREYFLSGEFTADLNLKNPLGTGGELANAFAEVLKEIWSGNLKVFAPRRFKQVLGQVNSQFQGYQQHDSQELLTLMADALHEDLNRVRQKPVTDPVESNGRPDEVVAKESWDTFKKRNDSKIVDEMYGLLKSHLVCNVCKKEAVKFDAYSNISVPVPSTIMVKLNVIFVDLQGIATRCVVSVPKRSNGSELAEWLCKRFSIPSREELIIGEMGYSEATCFYYHREAITGGVVPTHGSVEGFDRKQLKDATEHSRIIAWQILSKDELAKKSKELASSTAAFESKWSAFFKELSMIIAASSSSSPTSDTVITRCKELFALKYTAELSGPFPIAQRRLVKGLRSLENSEVSQAIAREALRITESTVDSNVFGLSVFIEPDLLREANLEDGNISGGELGDNGSSSDASSSTASKQSLPKRTISAPFRFFRSKPASNGTANGPNNSPSTSMRNLTATSTNGTSTPTEATPTMSTIDPKARIAIEVRHSRAGLSRGRRVRCPYFFAVTAETTCDALRAEIDEHVKRMLKGFNPNEADQNAQSNSAAAAAADAAQLELNSHPRPVKADKDSVSSFSSASQYSSFYKLEVEGTTRAKLPEGPVTIGESLAAKYPVNALTILVNWKDCAAATYVFRTVDQDDANPEKYTDADIGLGRIVLDSSSNPKNEEAERGDKQVITLQRCLEVFRQREQLGEDDPWYCDSCKAHRCAFKTMDLWDTPRILVIHLKRFLYERAGGALGERVQRDKITDLVTFPMKDFDVGPMLVKNLGPNISTKYDLFAVSNHMGGLGGGHYTAYVKAEDGSWWLMNDGVATQVDKNDEEAQVVSPNAYVLFYRRKE